MKNNPSTGSQGIAGLTQFLAMVYIIFLIPGLTQDTGAGTSIAMTALICGAFTLIFAFSTRLPYGVGPGIVPALMMLNFFSSGIPWQQALAIAFIAGLLFTLLIWTGTIHWISNKLDKRLVIAAKFGIGIYLLVAALIASNIATQVNGHYTLSLNWESLCFFIGIAIVIAANEFGRLRNYAILLGILTASLAALILIGPSRVDSMNWLPVLSLNLISSEALQSVLQVQYIDEILTFAVVLIIDVVATLDTIGSSADDSFSGFAKRRNKSALMTSGLLASVGPALGFTTPVVFFESLSAVKSGARNLRCGLVTAGLFFLAVFAGPIAIYVPVYASAVALAYVGYSVAKYQFMDLRSDRITRYMFIISVIVIVFFRNISLGLLCLFAAYPVVVWLKEHTKARRFEFVLAFCSLMLIILFTS